MKGDDIRPRHRMTPPFLSQGLFAKMSDFTHVYFEARTPFAQRGLLSRKRAQGQGTTLPESTGPGEKRGGPTRGSAYSEASPMTPGEPLPCKRAEDCRLRGQDWRRRPGGRKGDVPLATSPLPPQEGRQGKSRLSVPPGPTPLASPAAAVLLTPLPPLQLLPLHRTSQPAERRQEAEPVADT